METYHGHMRTLRDALMVIEACCLNILPRVRHRLSDRERCLVQSGTVFVWDESETGMRRWTDGRSWSPSRVVNGFLSYRELAGRRQRTPVDSAIPVGRTPNIRSVSRREFRYQPDGLIKRALSFRTTSGRRWHLISYYRESSIINGQLITPSADPRLAHIQLPPGIYPEDLMDQPEDSPINGTNQLIPNRPITSASTAAVTITNFVNHTIPDYLQHRTPPQIQWPLTTAAAATTTTTTVSAGFLGTEDAYANPLHSVSKTATPSRTTPSISIEPTYSMTASNAKRTFPDTSPPHRNTSDVNLPRSAIRTQDDREGVKRRGLDRSGHGQIVIRLPGTRHASVLNISTLGHANGLGTPTSHSPTRIDHDKLSPMLISPNAQQFTNTNVTSEGSAYARLSSAPDPLRLSAPLLSPNDMSHYTRMDNNDNDRHQYYHHYHQHQNTNNHNNNNTNTSQYPPTSIQSYPSRGLTTAPTGSADKNLRGIQSRPRGHSMHASSSPFYPAPLADGLKIYSNRHSRAGSAGVSANLHYDANPFIQRRTSLMAEYQANTSTSNSMPRSNPSSVERPLETYHDTATSIQPHTLLYANSPRRHSSRRRATHEPSVSPTRHTRGDAMGPQTSPLRPVSYNTPALSLHFRRDRTPVVHDSLTSAPTVPPEPESPVYNRGIRSRSMQPIDEHLSLHPDRHSHGDGRSRLLPLQGWQQEAALALQESPSGLTTQPDHFPSYTANTSVPPMHSRHYENRPHMSMPVSFMAPTTILHSGAIDTSTHRRRATTGNPLPVTAAATMPPVASLSPRQAIAHESFQGQRRSSEQSPAQQITLPRLSTENLAMHYAQQMAAQNATLPTLPTMMMELDTTHRGWTARSPMAGTSALPLTAAATALATTTTHPQHGPQLHPVISQATPSTQLWSAEDRRQMDQLHKSLQL